VTEPSYLFAALEHSGFGRGVMESVWAFPALETAHVIGLAIVIGSILLLDIILLGVVRVPGGRDAVAKSTLPWTWAGFALALATGAAMFSSAATRYAANPLFLAKIVLLVLAGVNMAFFNLHPAHPSANENAPLPPALRVSAALSLCLWLGVVITGRWIGFV
jgi:hypothetical protein